LEDKKSILYNIGYAYSNLEKYENSNFYFDELLKIDENITIFKKILFNYSKIKGKLLFIISKMYQWMKKTN
jgi:tetratricopeptide (TPR) repeat protein